MLLASFSRVLKFNKFISSDTTNEIDTTDERSDNLPKVLFPLPFIDQKTTDNTRKQLQSLSHKIGVSLQPVFTSAKIGNILKTSEKKTQTLLTSNALFTLLYVVFAIKTMSVSQIDTYINASWNTQVPKNQAAQTEKPGLAPLVQVSPEKLHQSLSDHTNGIGKTTLLAEQRACREDCK